MSPFAPTAVTQLPSRACTDIADVIFGAASGSVLAVAGTTRDQILRILDGADRARESRLALFVPLRPAASAEQIVEHVADVLAATALRMWPVWFSDVSFAGSRDDTLGQEAVRTTVRQAAEETRSIVQPWAEAAAISALSGRMPRMRGVATAMEIEQLCVAINRSGLILVVDVDAVDAPSAALVHALEWISHNAHAAVVALFARLPDNKPPFDRILHGAVCITTDPNHFDLELSEEPDTGRPWLVPVRGIPHPLSETEQRLAKALGRDRELAPLFGFNQCVETVHGNRPKVDLIWKEGRLVVELDGYADHGSRAAFMHDRHRDYELTLAGYTVLRLANDEIAQDIEKAIEKIRDIVQLCRARTT